MIFPNYSKRDYLLPVGCEDLSEALKLAQQSRSGPEKPQYPPVTRKIRLPEKVAVRFIAEVSGKTLAELFELMRRLRIGGEVNRSIDFSHAQLILRHYGIWADHESSAK